MGYKRAGFDVLGNVEIDNRINELYIKNNSPKYNFNMDIRDFNKLDSIPEELFNLDILDGSPPCSTFSMIGSREKSWGKKKIFREGQKKQILDDLFFSYLDCVRILRPKIFIAENVKGILMGNAKGYVNEIVKKAKSLGYDIQIFLFNAALMDVPQFRERVFFIGNRMGFPKLNFKFDGKPIRFGEIRSKIGIPPSGKDADLLEKRLPSDKYVTWIEARETRKKKTNYRHIISDNDVCCTITSGGKIYRGYDGMEFSNYDFARVQTFPTDYDFMGESVQYACGMSVPPNMMANIAKQIYIQWFGGD